MSAGAGTGKTTVLVERFVRAVCDEGLDVESVLVITYTRKAAGELRARIRAALRARSARPRAPARRGVDLDDPRLLLAAPPRAPVRSRRRPAVPRAGRRARSGHSRRGLRACARVVLRRPRTPERLRLLATYGAQGLRRKLTGVYETLRSAGRELTLELSEQADIAERLAELHDEARVLAADSDCSDKQLAAAQAALALSTTNPERLLDLTGLRASGDRAAPVEAARKRLEQAAFRSSRRSGLVVESARAACAAAAACRSSRCPLRARAPRRGARRAARRCPPARSVPA